ncbi:hypothetical protein SO802_018107 [Lithocarpus litseifolius]|uniref:Uncharacterized protein n=1 Tax=Lithocarpus litseifolius TaxID=425828 RepID=A0AAW2CMT8_9ROSI
MGFFESPPSVKTTRIKAVIKSHGTRIHRHRLQPYDQRRDVRSRPLLHLPPQCSTRLTVCVENHSQALALNSSNPILKTYDLDAVMPLDQNAFDDACDKSERRVYFEIMYSDLIADVQTRKANDNQC